MWSCPHCGAAQAAASRCWVCRRSSTTCSTCRHFRTSLAAEVGWCALDRRRRPLTGLEMRGCWTERPTAASAVALGEPRTAQRAGAAWRELPVRDFVPVDGPAAEAGPATLNPQQPSVELPIAAVDPTEGWDGRVSLFGDAER